MPRPSRSPDARPSRSALERRALRPRSGHLAIALAASLLATARSAHADPTPSLALEPAPAGDHGVAVERVGVRGHLLPSAKILVDYAHRPLVLQNRAQEIDNVVARQAWVHVLASFSLSHRLLFSVDLPFVASQAAGYLPASGSDATRVGGGASFGDLRLGARVKLLGSAHDAAVRHELGVAGALWFPTATEGYSGDGSLRGRLAIVAESVGPRLYGAFNGGVRTRPAEKIPGALPSRVATSLAFGLAAGFFADAAREIALGAELVADLPIAGGARLFDPRASVVHLLLTGNYRLFGGPFELGASFGPGIGQGAGSADYRVMGLVGYAPERAPRPPDKDGDGLEDKVDACVDLAGTASSDPLLNGCPPPPVDTDGDAIPDEFDACPKAAGEATFVRKTHGCPRFIDTDNDGVADADDICPFERGLRPPEGDGCPPEEAEPGTRLVEQEIVLSQQVQFETDTSVLRPESDKVLSEVARVLRRHPELELVEVQGHTDDTGTAEHNQTLSQDRAARVVAWLVARAVEAARLRAKGYGAERPIADNGSEEGRTKNRRVEFKIVRRKAAEPAPAAPHRGEGP
jgi:OOP family OmpA-OmpF porin